MRKEEKKDFKKRKQTQQIEIPFSEKPIEIFKQYLRNESQSINKTKQNQNKQHKT